MSHPIRSATVITGFLGSGKTTLLNRLLTHERFGRSAVLVNEFGEVGIDNALLRFSTERVAVLANGCICCSIREDLEEAVRSLLKEEASGTLPPFDHLFIETSGLADPVPLIQTFFSSPALRSRFIIRSVVTTVDAVLGVATIDRYPEAARQVALADTVIVTKSDLLGTSDAVDPVMDQISGVNRSARVIRADLGPQGILSDDLLDRFFISPEAYTQKDLHTLLRAPFTGDQLKPVHLLNSGIRSFGIVIDHAMDWTAFGAWLTWFLHRHSASVLRVKGLLYVSPSAGPVAFHCVQHMVYPPVHLEHWGGIKPESRLTFIVKDLDCGLIERSLNAFNGLARIATIADEGFSHYKAVGAGSTIRGHPVRRPSTPRWLR